MPVNTRVKRVKSIMELPDAALLCAAFGHSWDRDMVAVSAPDFGRAAAKIELRCNCGRIRNDVFNVDTMEIMYREYDGGVLMEPGAWEPRHVARGEWFRRIRSAQLRAEREVLAGRNMANA